MSLTCLPTSARTRRHRRLARLLGARLVEQREGFERELGVDREHAGVARQADDAIGARIVGERGLELVGAGGQAVAHDRLHPPLAEGAARLLVGENVLQRDDFLGHAGDARLRGVDDGEPFVELAEVGAGGLRVAFEPGAEPRADVVEALRHHPRHVRLPRAQPFAHRAQTPG